MLICLTLRAAHVQHCCAIFSQCRCATNMVSPPMYAVSLVLSLFPLGYRMQAKVPAVPKTSQQLSGTNCVYHPISRTTLSMSAMDMHVFLDLSSPRTRHHYRRVVDVRLEECHCCSRVFSHLQVRQHRPNDSFFRQPNQSVHHANQARGFRQLSCRLALLGPTRSNNQDPAAPPP